jgi:polysaccharide biosynthesis/export protein
MVRMINIVLLLTLTYIWLCSAHAQELPQRPSIAEDANQFPEYQVGPGDLLSIRVFGLSQFDQTTRISNSGRIHVPYVGVVPVANMTVVQIENEIAKQIRDRQLVKEPWVRVQVVEYNAQPVFVIGEVTTPGQFVIIGDMRLLDVIAKAGGLRPSAAEEAVLIMRRGGSKPETDSLREILKDSSSSSSQPKGAAQNADGDKRMKISIAELTDGSHPELNVRLQGGDVFYIPTRPTQHIYIIGEVGLPGAYILPRSYSHLTAASALSYAGGPRRRSAKSSKSLLVRRDQEGTIQTVQFNFDKAIRGEEPDTPIKPGDIIFVPRSVGKMIGYKFFDMIANETYQWMIF